MEASVNPTVSVCIPTYCRAKLLRRALDSALAQDFGPMEIIVSDNYSEDGSWDTTAKLGELDPRLTVRRNEKNLGWTGNLNKCIKAARGKYLIFLCDDDELMPGMVKASHDFMEAHPGAGLVHTAAYFVGITGRSRPVVPEIEPFIEGGIAALTHTALAFNIIFSSAMARAECFKKLDWFVESISADYEMWSRIAARYGVGYIKTPLVRVHVHSISPKMTVERFVSESTRLRKRVMELFPEHMRDSEEVRRKGWEQMAVGMRSLGVQALQAGYWRNGFDFLAAVKKYSPGYRPWHYLCDVLFRAAPRRLLFLLHAKKRMASTHV